MDNIYSKKEANIVYKYVNFLSKDTLELNELVFSEQMILDYDNKYKMENYKGNIYLTIDKSTILYKLYYKDVLIGSYPWSVDVASRILHILSNNCLDQLSFEHRLKKDEILEFWQYVTWDTYASNIWFSKKFNEQYKESSLTLDQYTGKIRLMRSNGPYLFLGYDKQVIRSGYFCVDSLRYMILEDFATAGLAYKLVTDQEEFRLDYLNFRKHIMGSSDELLNNWLHSDKIIHVYEYTGSPKKGLK